MNRLDTSIAQQVKTIVEQLAEQGKLGAGQIMVFGVSTSEVIGEQIGTSGAEDVAAQVYEGITQAQQKYHFDIAFQCCEHLNRALVIERATRERLALPAVSAIPVADAGGSMAAYAFRQLQEPCLVEAIEADAGVDIGDTLIGMHLRPVAVPFRPTVKQVGQAHVTAAFSRPKLIGGARAVYE